VSRFPATRRRLLNRVGLALMVGAGVPGCLMLGVASAPHMLGPMLEEHGPLLGALLATGLLGLWLTRMEDSRTPERRGEPDK
jgi:hypothetical protein